MRRFRNAALVVCVLVAGMLAFASAQTSPADADLQKRMAALEAGQKAILAELQAIRALLQQQTQQQARGGPPAPAPSAPPANPAVAAANAAAALQPPTTPIAIDGAAGRGNPNAKVVLVEFSDFECPFCGRYTRDIEPQLVREYVDTGKIRYVFRNYPIEQLHAHAFKAAEAAECVRQQGKFWEMHGQLYSHQQNLTDPDLLAHAKVAGADTAAFQQCVTGPGVMSRIRQDQADGRTLMITGTPTFFAGTLKDGKVHALRKIVGARPYADFKSAIDAVIASPDAK